MTRGAQVLLFCVLLIAVGCGVSSPTYQSDARAHPKEDIALNAEQMRRRVRALVQPMSGVIVASADQITAGTTDRTIRREALLWKIEAVPALRESLFTANPMAAIFDAWVMTFQMTDYFENGPGARALGEASAVAVSTSKHLEAEMGQVAASITHSGDVSKAREYARKLAADHPIQHSITARESVASIVTTSQLADALSVEEAVGSVVVSADDLNRRLGIYSAQFLDQARWQAELFAMDQGRELQLEQAVPLAERAVEAAGQAADNFARIVPALERPLSALEKALPSAQSAAESAGRAADRTIPLLERSVAVLEKTPALLANERESAIKALSGELTRTIASVQDERIAVLTQLTAERIAAERDVTGSRDPGTRAPDAGNRCDRFEGGRARVSASLAIVRGGAGRDLHRHHSADACCQTRVCRLNNLRRSRVVRKMRCAPPDSRVVTQRGTQPAWLVQRPVICSSFSG